MPPPNTPRIDSKEVFGFLNMLAGHGHVVELRLLKVGGRDDSRKRTMSGYFTDFGALAECARKHGPFAQGSYVTLNELNLDLLARSANRVRVVGLGDPLTGDADVIRRRWLPLDFDPVRPSGISSTDEEHARALARTRDVRDALRKLAWPEPIVADSGNGAHLLYRIDMDASDGGLIKRVLEALAFQFDDEFVKVDQAVFNPARIWKLYGTISQKGDSLPNRPHRLARLLGVPNTLEIVSLEMLQSLAHRLPNDSRGTSQGSSSSFDLEQWIRSHSLEVKGPASWRDGRRWILPVCPFNPEHSDGAAYIVQFGNGAVAAGCHHNGCKGKIWHDLRDLVEPGWRSNANHYSSGIPVTPDSPWDTPAPFHEHKLSPFPTEALPTWLGDFVRALAVATQTPTDLPAMLALAAVSAACAQKVAVLLKEGYIEPVNLYTVTAQPSGSRKTAVFAAITTPLEEYERVLSRRAGRENAKLRSERKIAELKQKRLQEQAASVEAKDRDQVLKEAEQLATDLADAPALQPTRLLADDCTPERLATLLCDNCGRIAVMSAEGDIFEILAGRYSISRTANFLVYLKGHAGEPLRIDRVGRTEHIARPALTVGLAVQPDVIRGLAGKPGFRERGLLARFLYAMPANLLGKRDTNPPPVPPELTESYRANLRALLDIQMPSEGQAESSSHLLKVDEEAREVLHEFERWVEPQLAEFEELGTMTDWGGKLVGAVGRIAGLLHMAQFARGSDPRTIPIGRDIMERAIRIGKYLIPHAQAAFAEMGADLRVENAKRMLRWIEHQNCSSFTRRDIHQGLRGTFQRVAETDSPLELLIEHDFIRRSDDPSPGSGPGRKPSPRFEVNPIWLQSLPQPRISEDCEDSELIPRQAGSGLE